MVRSRVIRGELREWLRFLRSDGHVLLQHPGLIYTQAANQPDSTAPATAARHWQQSGRASPWLRWVTKAQTPSAVMMTLTGHQGPVRACACSNDGRRILSGSADGTLKLWDAGTGAELLTFKGHAGPVTACAFSPDEETVLSGSEDGTLKLWRVETAIEQATLGGHTGPVRACAFSRRGDHIVSAGGGDDRSLKLWDARTGAELLTLTGHEGEVLTCAFSPDGALIISGSADKTLKLWEAATGNLLFTLEKHQGPIRACAVSPDGNRLVSGAGFVAAKAMFSFSEVMELAAWDLTSRPGRVAPSLEVMLRPEWADPGASARQILELFDPRLSASVAVQRTAATTRALATTPDQQLHEGGILGCAFSPDGARVVSASSDSTVKLWDAATLSFLGVLSGHAQAVNACAWSPLATPRGDLVVSGSEDGTVKVWDISLAASTSGSQGRKLEHLSYRLSPDGRYFASGAAVGQMLGLILLWEVETGILLGTMAGHEYCAVVSDFSPDGRLIITRAIMRGPPLLWDVSARKRAATLGPQGEVTRCVFSPDGAVIVVAEETLSLWDAATHRELRRLAGQPSVTTNCGFSPDGATVVAVGGDDSLRLWDRHTGELLQTWNGVKGWFVFSPEGNRILCPAPDQTLRLRDRETGRELGVVPEATVPCCFSPDGARIVSAGPDRSLTVRDAETATSITMLVGHTDRINSCAFSPDAKRVLSASADHTVRVWDAGTGRELSRYDLPAGIEEAQWRPDGRSLVIGDRAGQVFLMSLENVPVGPPVVTAWHQGSLGGLRRLFRPLQFGCPLCRTWSAIAASSVGRERDCPHCDRVLRFNSFTIDADWRPIAEAWGNPPSAIGRQS